jgi:NEDD8-activating enzyme E1 regulatory subunit
MKAQSKVYIELQNLYKTKARRDAAEVLELAQKASGGRDIDPEEVELFCKNAAFVKMINAEVTGADHLATVAGKFDPQRGRNETFRIWHWLGTGRLRVLTFATAEQLANDESAEEMMMPMSLIPIYLALLATSHAAHGSPEDIVDHIGKIVPKAADNKRLAEAAQEIARAGGGELHNTSALTGGMVAQEMIKIITKQYIPVENTCIFDGITSRCQVLRL